MNGAIEFNGRDKGGRSTCSTDGDDDGDSGGRRG